MRVPTTSELRELSFFEVSRLRDEISEEFNRQQIIEYLPTNVEALQAEHQKAAGVPPAGSNWQAPTGLKTAYAVGQVVTHNGVRWKSLCSFNTAEPGTNPALWGKEDEGEAEEAANE